MGHEGHGRSQVAVVDDGGRAGWRHEQRPVTLRPACPGPGGRGGGGGRAGRRRGGCCCRQADAGRIQLDDKGVGIELGLVAVEAGVVAGAEAGREVRRASMTRDVGLAGVVHGDAPAKVLAPAAEEGGIAQPDAGRIQLDDEDIVVTVEAGVVAGAEAGREVRRSGIARDVGLAGIIYGDAPATIAFAAAEEGGIVQAGAGRVELDDKGVATEEHDCRSRHRHCSWCRSRGRGWPGSPPNRSCP